MVAYKYMYENECIMGTITTIMGSNPYCIIDEVDNPDNIILEAYFNNMAWMKSTITDTIIFRISHYLTSKFSQYTLPIKVTDIPDVLQAYFYP